MQTNNLARWVSKVFNISPREVVRVLNTWVLRFLYYLGFFLSWTLSIALFVDRYGIFYLPLFYIAQAGFSIFGSFIYSQLTYRIALGKLLFITVVGLVLSLFLAVANLTTPLLFFVFLLLATGIFIPQIDILLARYSEENFSPLESQRVLPFIDSTEPIGGILAGILISTFIGFLHAETFLFFVAGVFSLLLAAFFLVVRVRRRSSVTPDEKEHGTIVSIKRGLEHLKAISFMRGLAILVFVWILAFNTVEIHFTKTVEELLHHGSSQEHAESIPSAVETVHGAAEEHPPVPVSNILSEDKPERSALKDVLAERLGSFQILFSALVFIMQLFFSSRILHRLGLIRSFFCMPLLALFGSVPAIFFSGGLLLPAYLKGVLDTLGSVHKVAYHNAYYAIPEHIREHIRELMEGVVRPVGVIVSMAVIFSFQYLFQGGDKLFINILLTVAFAAMIFITRQLRKEYTSIAKKNLEMSKEFGLKSHAIEILSQKGHENAADILSKSLLYRKETSEVKVKILHALGDIQDPLSLPEILLCLQDSDLEVKIAACQALSKFKNLGQHFYSQAFSQHRIIVSLTELFHHENSKRIRSAIIRTFARLQHANTVPFLIETIQNTDDEVLIADSIYVMGLFKDVSTWHYVSPFLTSSNPRIKANAIIALWQFEKYRLQLLIHLLALLESKDKNNNLSGIYAVGEIKAIQELPLLKKFLAVTDDMDIRRYAAVALLKLNQDEAIAPLLSLLFEEGEELALKTYEDIREIHNKTSLNLRKLIHTEGTNLVNRLLFDHGLHHSEWKDLPREKLVLLLRYYRLLDHEKEAFRVKNLLRDMEASGQLTAHSLQSTP